jgi:hypothetical protein
MDYLSGKLSEQDKHEVEKWMADNDFANEAVEGLEHFSRKKNLQVYVDSLNKDLHNYISQKKERRDKRKIIEFPWIYVAIIFVLAIIILTYFIIQKLQH